MSKDNLDSILKELDIDFNERKKEITEFEKDFIASSSPAIKILSSIILEAIQLRASDIHIETYEKSIRIRYRIDGVLREIKKLPKSLASSIFSRLKVISGLDIAEKRMPQDGRFQGRVDERDIDFRVSIIATMYGEKAVLRILDKKNFNSSLEKLGFLEKNYEKIISAINRSSGMIIIAGPTGSGKSTTLYSIINRLNCEEINILTAEDPIEYEIEGINQVQCRSDIGFGFSNILRNFLRQDPDIIMVGEIRDRETGEISLKASLTGHLLLSTLHTQDVFTAIGRLINLGLEPHLIAGSISLILSQRLVRKLCSWCATEDMRSEEKLRKLQIDPKKYENIKFYENNGCDMCNGGYQGRIAFEEVLAIDDTIREMIEKRVSVSEFRKYAKSLNIKNLKESGIDRAVEGLTTLDEIIRMC